MDTDERKKTKIAMFHSYNRRLCGFKIPYFGNTWPRSLTMPDPKHFNVRKAQTTVMFVIQVGKYEDCA